MIVTLRDRALTRDIALSIVLSRDQIIQLGYFGSVTRANTRLRLLASLGLVNRLETPFFSQSLYCAARKAAEIVGENIAPLIEGRKSSPRFIQHAMQVTNVRLALLAKTEGEWRFEQQLWRKLPGSNAKEVRPDGLFIARDPIFVEVDMGHVGLPKFKEKVAGYQALADPSTCEHLYGFPTFRLLVLTTGNLRARRLRAAFGNNVTFDWVVQTFESVGAAPISCWS